MYKIKLLISIFLLSSLSIESQTFSVTTNGGSGLALTYSSLANAIVALNTATISSPVIITCAAGEEVAPSGGFIIEAVGTNVNTIVIQGAGGTSSTIKAPNPAGTAGALNDALLKLRGADFVTIEGFNLTENPLNTTTAAATNNMVEWGIALLYKSLTDGSQNNTIQNNTITLNRTYQNTFGIYSNTRHSSTAIATTAEVTAATGSNSFNKVYGNTISNVKYGIIFIGAGTTIAAIDDGNDIGGTSAATGNSITNWGNGTTSSGYISLTGSNYCIFANQQVNDNVSYSTITSAALTSNITTGGILKNNSVAPPPVGSTFSSNYTNNIVTVTNNPTAAAGGTIIGVNTQGIAAVIPNATINVLNNTVQNCVLGGTTSATGGMTCILNLCAAGTVNIQNNVINNNSLTSPAATNPVLASIVNATGTNTGKLFITDNVITNMASSAASGQMQGIVNSQTVTTEVNILDNQLGTATNNFFLSNVNSAGALFGIINSGGTATCAVTIMGNDIRGINYSANPTASQILIQNSAVTLSQTIESNTYTNLSIKTTGPVSFIINSVALSATGSKNINNNSIVGSFAKTAAGSFIRFYGDGASSVAGSIINNNNNNFSNVTVVGNTSIVGWSNQDGLDPSDSGAKTFSNNTFDNITGGTGNVVIADLDWGLTNVISDNTFTNITVEDTIFVMLLGVNNNGIDVSGNVISNISSTGLNGRVIGLAAQGSLDQPAIVTNNLISSITNAGSANTTGLYLLDSVNVSKNTICDISGTNSSAIVRGIQVFGKSFISNNKISNLQATTANNVNAIRGIDCEVTSEAELYYNSIFLNAISTGTDFGSSAVFVDTGAVAITMNNNIFSNQSTPNGTGLSAAYRRSGNSLANIVPTSNNNDFFASTIFTDGTNTFTAIGPGTGTYKDFVAPIDANSISNDPLFLSTACGNTNYLKIDASSGSLVNDSGVNIPSVTDDFDGDPRNPTTPDMGADEVIGTACSLTVTSSLDSGAGSLRSAVGCAVTGNTITIDPTVTNITLTSNLDIVGKILTFVSTAGTPPMLSFDSNSSILQIAAAAGLTLNNIHVKDVQASIVNPVLVNNGSLNLLASKVTGTGPTTFVKVNNNTGATMSVDTNSSITNQ